MYRVRTVLIKKGHRLHGFCRELCFASAALYNRANFVVRQYATAVRDLADGKSLTENQLTIYELVKTVTAGTKYAPSGKWLSYGTLDFVLKVTKDADYYALPAQANQQILRLLLRDYNAFFRSLETYSKTPGAFTGRPKLPGYAKDGKLKTAILTNQICRVTDDCFIKFPLTKTKLNTGINGLKLKEVRIKSRGNAFEIGIVHDVQDIGIRQLTEPAAIREERNRLALQTDITGLRVIAIDPGVTNFVSLTNNFGERPLIISGGPLKSINQFYNKKLAQMKSEAKLCNKRNTTRRIERLQLKRNNLMKDRMHKISRFLATYCLKHKVNMVLLGHNLLQKQHTYIGHVNNQIFVQIPFAVFADMLGYKLAEYGIPLIPVEESYTSKADYLAGDPIPIFGEEDGTISFSGKRVERGLYRHFDGAVSNADINGAANILRKAFPKVTQWDRGVVDTPFAVRIA